MPEKTSAGTTGASLKGTAGAARNTKKPTATRPRSRTAAARPAATTGRQDNLYERVQRRAYELWESEGRPAGREHDHWLQAEREIASARGQHAGLSW